MGPWLLVDQFDGCYTFTTYENFDSRAFHVYPNRRLDKPFPRFKECRDNFH